MPLLFFMTRAASPPFLGPNLSEGINSIQAQNYQHQQHSLFNQTYMYMG